MPIRKQHFLKRSKTQLVLHLLFGVEGVEVVVIGELGATGDLPKSKKTNPVNSIHRPKSQKLQPCEKHPSKLASEIIKHATVDGALR